MTDYVTDDYKLEVADKTDKGLVTKVYRVINKTHDVIEYEDYLLPRAIDSMLEIQQRLGDAKSKFKTPGRPALTLVENNDGGDTAH